MSLGRMQPPVVSTVSARGFGAAARAAVTDGRGADQALTGALTARFGATSAVATDSGTSALVLALRAVLPRGGTVALPAYVCVDLLAAAEAVQARVRLYDIDPATLSPDLASVEATLARGADAIVVAHLYGFPADIDAVARLAASHGAAVIEDAAQGAAGTLCDRLLGAFGPLSILSFGRGKGVTGGGGGALLATDSQGADAVARVRAEHTSSRGSGWKSLGITAAQWMLARPSLYAVPASLPFLRLGETVYHPAHDAQPIAAASAALAADALGRADDEARRRTAVARRVIEAVGTDTTGIRAIDGGRAGYLRLPVRRARTEPAPALGVLRGYPATLADYANLRHLLHDGEVAGPGAVELRDTLFTLPTHHHVRDGDVRRLADWLRVAPTR